MQESKCSATDRLRREGRWEEACQFRDAERRRLRAEGKCKTEANELAWQSMLNQFPPQYIEALAMARFQPRIEVEDAAEGERFAATWWAFCTALAWFHVRADYPDDLRLAEQVVESQIAEAPSEIAQALTQSAFDLTELVNEIILGDFTKMLERLTDSKLDEACRSELTFYRDEIWPMIAAALAITPR